MSKKYHGVSFMFYQLELQYLSYYNTLNNVLKQKKKVNDEGKFIIIHLFLAEVKRSV
jgi:hypothetical protein